MSARRTGVWEPAAFLRHRLTDSICIGTWTKASTHVGPRRPLGRDTAQFDYAYDSEEDWEEEEEGEAKGEEVDADAMSVDSEDESDADSWLAPDDEIEVATGFSGSPPPLDDDPFLTPAPPVPVPKPAAGKPYVTKKRKAATGAAREGGEKKRKVVPLVPWIKGPHWEDGNAKEVQAFKAHRIRLLNGERPILPSRLVRLISVTRNAIPHRPIHVGIERRRHCDCAAQDGDLRRARSAEQARVLDAAGRAGEEATSSTDNRVPGRAHAVPLEDRRSARRAAERAVRERVQGAAAAQSVQELHREEDQGRVRAQGAQMDRQARGVGECISA